LKKTNVYSVRGRALVAGSCLPEVEPEAYGRQAAEADQVYSLCLETTHINTAVTKLSAIFGTGQLEKLVLASVDRSSHCTQLHFIKHEIERTLPKHVPVEDCVVSGGRIVPVPDAAIEPSSTRRTGQEGAGLCLVYGEWSAGRGWTQDLEVPLNTAFERHE